MSSIKNWPLYILSIGTVAIASSLALNTTDVSSSYLILALGYIAGLMVSKS